MRAVVQIDGITEFNWMWMPSFIGHNRKLREEMEKELGPRLVGHTLDEAHESVLTWIQEHFPQIGGLRDYLAAIRLVRDSPEG
jgi:hypothetical protein